MKKIRIGLLLLTLALLAGCGQNGGTGDTAPASLSFRDAVSIDTINKLNGKPVTIIGYMATLSPVSGKYIYLMNMPYQSCPFCVPNTSQLANTMAVYAPEGKIFTYTDQAVRITGTMQVGSWTDDFGYEYTYRITDAKSEEIDLSTVSDEYKLWQSIASDGIVSTLDEMFNFVHFLCQWSHYTSGYVDENGNEITYNLYPGDVTHYLEDDGMYGYADKMTETYFPGLVNRIRSISPDGLEDLVTLVNDAETVAKEALEDLNGGAYTFDAENDIYIQTNDEQLYTRFYEVYSRFSEWLAKWEL